MAHAEEESKEGRKKGRKEGCMILVQFSKS
jgi:hypothetical protein